MYKISQDITAEPVSTDDVRQFIKHTDDTDTDEIELIEDMIKGVRWYIERQTGLALAEKTIIEYFERDNNGQYVLNIAPVISVDKVELLDLEETATELTLNEDYFKSGLYEKVILTNEVSNSHTLKVTYTAGYGDDTEPLPFDLKQAVMRQVKQWYDNRDEYLDGTYMSTVHAIIKSYQRIW
ncbi:MAG: head-tail connector protein [Perlabentimonas sp.]